MKKELGLESVKEKVKMKVRRNKGKKDDKVKEPERRSTRIRFKALLPGMYKEEETKKVSKPLTSKNNVKLHLPLPSDDPDVESDVFKCILCDKTYWYKNSLNKHFDAVHKAATFSCDICFNAFSYSANLKRHMAQCHATTVSSYQCKECPQYFSYKHNMMSHIAKFHSREM